MKETLSPFETSVPIRVKRRNIPEDTILKSYKQNAVDIVVKLFYSSMVPALPATLLSALILPMKPISHVLCILYKNAGDESIIGRSRSAFA
jgi:hypothetical protein